VPTDQFRAGHSASRCSALRLDIWLSDLFLTPGCAHTLPLDLASSPESGYQTPSQRQAIEVILRRALALGAEAVVLTGSTVRARRALEACFARCSSLAL